MKILVVGGGSSGLITACILKKYLNYEVDLVYSKNIGIIGVGEGSTEHFNEFMRFLDITDTDVVRECDAAYKAGTLFVNWGVPDFMHSTAAPFNNKIAQYNYVYARQIAAGSSYMNPKTTWKRKVDGRFFDSSFIDKPPFNQYHFNTFKLNDFLIKTAERVGVKLYEDDLDVDGINIDETGNIVSINGKAREYNYDFYVDATGFKKLLITKLGGKWESYSKYLKVDSAITFLSEDAEEYNLWTTSTAMNSGWVFNFPTWGRQGNGYVYASDYISKDDAHKELEILLKKEITIGKEFKFDPGKIDRAWINNCCAVGISGSFIEPLEASSIATTIQQSFLLMHRLVNYNQKVIDNYNKSFNDITLNIRDFMALHYVTPRRDTLFWKDVAQTPLPDTLAANLEVWKYKLPIKEDFSHLSRYIIFTEDHHTMIMAGLGLFDKESIEKEYSSMLNGVKANANLLVNDRANLDITLRTLDHKNALQLIRNGENF